MRNLFNETKINKLQLKNRFIRSATGEGMASSTGGLTDRLINVYEKLAQGGVGLIITGATYLTKNSATGPGVMSIYDDAAVEDYKKFTDRIHGYECPIILQLVFIGENGETWDPSSPSKIDIKSMVEAFGKGALRAQRAGFDGVQIHMAHDTLLAQFLSQRRNLRQDEYGGTLENRTRILLEVYDEIRKRVGKDFNIFVKINGTDAVDEVEGVKTCRYACKQLADRGIDAIEISGGIGELEKKKNNPYQESIFREYATQIAAEVDVPVILVGFNRTPSVMNEILNTSQIEYFSLSRSLIRESDIVNLWRSDLNKESACISCFACFSRPGGNTCIFED